MLVSEASGRRWHVLSSVRVCGFGEVFRAVELVVLPSGEWGHEHSYFAVKVGSQARAWRVVLILDEAPTLQS